MNSQPEESNEWGANKGDWAVLSNEVPVLYRVYSTRMCWVLRCFWYMADVLGVTLLLVYGGCVGCYAATGIWRMCWVLCCYWYMADGYRILFIGNVKLHPMNPQQKVCRYS